MRVILLKDVKKQGKKDDIITVKDGYGKYLIDNNLAVKETKTSFQVLKNQTEKERKKEEEIIKECEKIKEKLEKMTIIFKVKTGKNDQVFGKISSKQISEELEKKGIIIDKKKITIDMPINTLGITKVKILLHKKVKAQLKIQLQK